MGIVLHEIVMSEAPTIFLGAASDPSQYDICYDYIISLKGIHL